MKNNLAKRAKKRREAIKPTKKRYTLFNKFVDGVFYPKIHSAFSNPKERKEYLKSLINVFE